MKLKSEPNFKIQIQIINEVFLKTLINRAQFRTREQRLIIKIGVIRSVSSGNRQLD